MPLLVGSRRILFARGLSVVVSDAFVAADGTAITSLAPAWTKNTAGSSNTAAPSVDSGRVHGENAATISLYYRADFAPGSADYQVEGDLVMRSDNNGGIMGVVGRCSPSAATFYQARYNTLANAWQLFKFVAGTGTQLGSDSGQVLTVDQAYALVLAMVGTTISLLVDGVLLITATDSAVTAAGFAGIRPNAAATSTTGVHLDNWRVRQ